jgi:hypothetical protein
VTGVADVGNAAFVAEEADLITKTNLEDEINSENNHWIKRMRDFTVKCFQFFWLMANKLFTDVTCKFKT